MKIKYISWIPAALIMVIIFAFSSRPAVSSNESSMAIVERIMILYKKIINVHYQPGVKEHITEILNLIVRKGAHFTEYALLAAATAFHLYQWKTKGLRLFLYSVLTVFLYAVTDEFHQTFVPGRAGLFKDVMIDTAGGVAGAFILIIVVIFLAENGKRKKFPL